MVSQLQTISHIQILIEISQPTLVESCKNSAREQFDVFILKAMMPPLQQRLRCRWTETILFVRPSQQHLTDYITATTLTITRIGIHKDTFIQIIIMQPRQCSMTACTVKRAHLYVHRNRPNMSNIKTIGPESLCHIVTTLVCQMLTWCKKTSMLQSNQIPQNCIEQVYL